MNLVKRDGHTHTEFCPHGSGDDVEKMIIKAINLGFTDYSVTEHAPLPLELKAHYRGSDSGINEASMRILDVDPYIKKIQFLKQKYRDQINIKLGFEIDYFADFETYTEDFINEYADVIEDSILSVHFLKGKGNKYWCVDNELEEFAEGLFNYYGDSQKLYRQYFLAVQDSVNFLATHGYVSRIGHMTLIKKFQDYYSLTNEYSNSNQKLIIEVLKAVKDSGFELDLNTAGLYKQYCNDLYPDGWIRQRAKKLAIPMVFGSDAHGIVDVGRAHSLAEFELSQLTN